ncbi:MAG TPA: hypothetical protein VMO26_27060 [Vicinamibacterales bacterium]|nr:hypothetical protein [Vicinamibacterales bacterium]
MRAFVFRLWVHDVEDGLVPEVAVRAETRMQAAAIALQHFISIARPFSADSYLECDPHEGEYLRVRHVIPLLRARGTRTVAGSRRDITNWLRTERPQRH